ncbi:MAG: DUF4426 domain-containing protein [Gammaproteobacteria bacterium]
MNNPIARFSAALGLLLLSAAATADNSTKVPGYTIHHNVFTTDALSPEVANAYDIRRSSNRAMLNVSVIRDVPGSTGKAVPARVTAVATNLMGQQRDVPLREVREGEAIYYIGDFLVGHREVLDFDLSVAPAGDNQAYSAHLTQEFFTK